MRASLIGLLSLAVGCSGDISKSLECRRRGVEYSLQKNYWLALDEFRDAVRLNPEDADAYALRGDTWYQLAEYDKAIADYSEAIRLGAKHAEIYNIRGLAWSRKNDNVKAVADYDEALRLDPKHAAAYASRSLVWLARKEYDKALHDCNESIRLVPERGISYVQRGDIYREMKDYDKAIAAYSEGIRRDPNNCILYEARARIWATCPKAEYRDGKQAVNFATRACELGDWRYARHIETLAAAYAENGDFDKAIAHQQAALSKAPTDKKPILQQQLDGYLEGKAWREE